MRRINQLLLTLLFAMTPAVNAYAEDAGDASSTANESVAEPSNMQSWEEEDHRSNWTWFGMGYESRRSFSEKKGASNPAASGGPGAGHGGPGGPGGRR